MKRDYANLDVLRSVAVLLVLFPHLIMALGRLDDPIMKAWGIRQLAQLGVLIFFIHTSLVLMMSLGRLEGKNVVGRFYIRRAFRIYPLAMLTVAVACAVKIPPHFESVYVGPTSSVVWQNLLLMQNLFHAPDIVGPMWSLPLEIQMYIVLPLLYVAASRIRSYFGAITLIVCGFGVWYIDSQAARRLGSQPLVAYAPWFFMGAAAYVLYQVVRPRLSPLLYCVCLLLLTAGPCVTQRFMPHDYRTGWVSWISGTVFALALPYFLEIRSEMVQRCSHTIATYSYGIYLSHVPIMWLAFHKLSGTPFLMQVILFLALIVAVPFFLYHGLEKPMIQLGGRISDTLAQERFPRAVSAQA